MREKKSLFIDIAQSKASLGDQLDLCPTGDQEVMGLIPTGSGNIL